MQTVEKQADLIIIDIKDDKDKYYVKRNEKAKLMSDAYTLIGCIYYRQNQIELALQNFAIAYDVSQDYHVIDNPNLSKTKE